LADPDKALMQRATANKLGRENLMAPMLGAKSLMDVHDLGGF
jgi:hypothetical protein